MPDPCQAPGKPGPTRWRVHGMDRQGDLLSGTAWSTPVTKVDTLSSGHVGTFENGNTKAHKRKMELNLKYLSLSAL